MISISHTKQGFSLIELMIVLAIGAILIAGVLGGFKWIAAARVSRTEQTLRAVKSSIEIFQAKVGDFPTSLDDLFIRPTNPTFAKRWSAGSYGVDSEVDLKDAWGNRIQYQRKAKGQPPYELYSWGPEGEGSSEDTWIVG